MLMDGNSCMVYDGEGLASQDCIEAIAEGDGREIFTSTNGQLRKGSKCATIQDGKMTMADCSMVSNYTKSDVHMYKY